MAERSNAAVLKTVVPFIGDRGFESYTLRQKRWIPWKLERWLSGRKRRIANPLKGFLPLPRVRIPASPPDWRSIMAPRLTTPLSCAVLILCLVAGCVERKMFIRTDPEGGVVYVDGRHSRRRFPVLRGTRIWLRCFAVFGPGLRQGYDRVRKTLRREVS